MFLKGLDLLINQTYQQLEQLQTLAINKKRLTMHNVIHLSVGHELGMDADSVGVEVLKCEVKDEPYDNDGNIIHLILNTVRKKTSKEI